jgi:SAM-dependent methyltransferase
MTMQVLLTRDQITAARRVMSDRGISAVDSPLRSLMRALRLAKGVSVGDIQKSWDVMFAVEFIEKHVGKDEAVADIGCYASELLVCLHKAGYTKLTGIDLNPKVRDMPYRAAIRYEVGNFMKTPFQSAAFKAITSISVIEHGFAPQALLAEMSRLLMPGGFFIASFDYWPEKIDTTGTTFFGMDWLIFSRTDVEKFVASAAQFGLHPTGRLEFTAKDKVIRCAGRDYTFATLVLRKSS